MSALLMVLALFTARLRGARLNPDHTRTRPVTISRPLPDSSPPA